MTGLPECNFPAFHAAAAELRARGYEVANPAEINAETGGDWHFYLRADIKALCDCDAIVLLPGWENSKGAHLELHVAHRLGLRVSTLAAYGVRACGSNECIAGQRDGVICANGECDRVNGVRPDGVATDQPAGWHVSFDGGLTWEYHADDPWGRLGERVAIVRPLIYGDGADWRTAGVTPPTNEQDANRG